MQSVSTFRHNMRFLPWQPKCKAQALTAHRAILLVILVINGRQRHLVHRSKVDLLHGESFVEVR